MLKHCVELALPLCLQWENWSCPSLTTTLERVVPGSYLGSMGELAIMAWIWESWHNGVSEGELVPSLTYCGIQESYPYPHLGSRAELILVAWAQKIWPRGLDSRRTGPTSW